VPNFTSFDDFQASKTLPVTVDGLIARFRDHPLDFQPGEGRKYSNSGYVLLTAVIEKASGKSYADFLTEAVFTPLGKMALTNYVAAAPLMLAAGALFDLPNSTSWTLLLSIVVGILVLQWIASTLWLRAFTQGPLEGLKLIGFSVWERKTGGGRNVTFPARSFSVAGERRSTSRPASTVPTIWASRNPEKIQP
jgi:CubicO group peptidase (beta-lactamase class C family)